MSMKLGPTGVLGLGLLCSLCPGLLEGSLAYYLERCPALNTERRSLTSLQHLYLGTHDPRPPACQEHQLITQHLRAPQEHVVKATGKILSAKFNSAWHKAMLLCMCRFSGPLPRLCTTWGALHARCSLYSQNQRKSPGQEGEQTGT